MDVTGLLAWLMDLHFPLPTPEQTIPALNSAIRTILSSNYFPLLDPFLEKRMKAYRQIKQHGLAVIDALVRLSPFIGSRDLQNIKAELPAICASADPVDVILPHNLATLFPVSASVSYGTDRVIAGSNPQLFVHLKSHINVSIQIDSIFVTFRQDDREGVEELEISEGILLQGHSGSRIVTERVLPRSISVEVVQSLIFKFGNVRIVVRNGDRHSPLSRPLRICPSPTVYSIETKLPSLCIIEVELPLVVVIAAHEEKLLGVHLGFEPASTDFPVVLFSRDDKRDFLRAEPLLGDIEPGESMKVDLVIMNPIKGPLPIQMKVSFRTEQSGTGEFTKLIDFDFQSPFIVHWRFYDTNFQEIPITDSLNLDPGSVIHFDALLTNDLSCPIDIAGIRGGTASIETGDLPLELGPTEIFTFAGSLRNPGVPRMAVEYEIESIGQSVYPFSAPIVRTPPPWLVFGLDAPPTVVRLKEFAVTVTIENPGWDVLAAALEVTMTSAFYVDGDVKKIVSVFGKQTKTVSVKFLALEAGSMLLPRITFTEAGLELKSRRSRTFLTPIVVTFQ
jgi:hypothetical protein